MALDYAVDLAVCIRAEVAPMHALDMPIVSLTGGIGLVAAPASAGRVIGGSSGVRGGVADKVACAARLSVLTLSPDSQV